MEPIKKRELIEGLCFILFGAVLILVGVLIHRAQRLNYYAECMARKPGFEEFTDIRCYIAFADCDGRFDNGWRSRIACLVQ